MAFYNERPPQVQAEQYDGTAASKLAIKTLTGINTVAEAIQLLGPVNVGDWIVKDSLGGFQVVGNADFVRKYVITTDIIPSMQVK